jgi:hypothetical protein
MADQFVVLRVNRLLQLEVGVINQAHSDTKIQLNRLSAQELAEALLLYAGAKGESAGGSYRDHVTLGAKALQVPDIKAVRREVVQHTVNFMTRRRP